ncbi:MAG: HU family DNA-binding protein, partial [Thermoleophilia bacterium]|nr:HU family DNA-binding protein [Thermoleophilia bacterium]
MGPTGRTDGMRIRSGTAISSADAGRLPGRESLVPHTPIQGVPVNKSEFVSRVAKNHDMSSADAGRAVTAVLKEIEDALRAGEDVSFAGFGKFSVSE